MTEPWSAPAGRSLNRVRSAAGVVVESDDDIPVWWSSLKPRGHRSYGSSICKGFGRLLGDVRSIVRSRDRSQELTSRASLLIRISLEI